MEEIEKLINSISYNKEKSSTYVENSNDKRLVLLKIKKLTIESGLFYCSRSEYSKNIKNQTGVISNLLYQMYSFSLKNKKTLFFSLLKSCLIENIDFYFNHQKQVFIDIKKFLALLQDSKFELEEKTYINVNGNISLYEQSTNRENQFKTVQQFKKWLDELIPTNIENIEVKKDGNHYIVSSNINISIPYKITSIKGLDVKLFNIDDSQNLYSNSKYQLINYQQKELFRVKKEIEDLEYIIVVKQQTHKTLLPKGLKKGKGSSQIVGKISDRAIERVLGLPKSNLAKWKKRDIKDYRFKLFLLLKNFTEDELLSLVEKSTDLLD